MTNFWFWLILLFLLCFSTFNYEKSYKKYRNCLYLFMEGLILSQNTMSSFSGVKSGGWDLPQPEVVFFTWFQKELLLSSVAKNASRLHNDIIIRFCALKTYNAYLIDR